MNFKIKYIFIFFSFSNSLAVHANFVITGLAATGLYFIAKLAYDHSVCTFTECCSEKEIPADFAKLQKILNIKVYGQHLVKEVVVNALKAHWRDPDVQKALVLSFHGWPGSGKNYVTKFIHDSLYAKGGNSNHVHYFVGGIHFPKAEKAKEYQQDLYNWIKGNVTRCPQQLFIFDADKIPPSVLNALKSMIDYYDHVDGVDYRKSVFIFLSNTGSRAINDQYLKLRKSGVEREDIRLKDFEKLILEGAFNEEGGLHHADPIKSDLIDHYVPFLPMEREHVRLCILDAFQVWRIKSPSEENIREVLDFVEWGPAPDKLFSTTGCKRISQKVGILVQKLPYKTD